MAEYMDSNGIERLCQAIIVQAAEDYRRALRVLQKNPESRTGLASKKELEQFFLSEWYQMMTNVDGEYLIRQLQEEFK